MFVSTKTYTDERGFSVCYRQWRSDSHCNKLHGYALGFEFQFQSEVLDVRNWVVDFGGLKTLKEKLDEWFDHTCLVAEDDPELETYKLLHDKKMIKMVEDRKGTPKERQIEHIIRKWEDLVEKMKQNNPEIVDELIKATDFCLRKYTK